ncbi:MAG: hypothetical protein LBI29_02225 [Rickettsiales bacterium]|jgi:hypothetical protein|nr:hypothetical protein [Rickettsiales bacterium]
MSFGQRILVAKKSGISLSIITVLALFLWSLPLSLSASQSPKSLLFLEESQHREQNNGSGVGARPEEREVSRMENLALSSNPSDSSNTSTAPTVIRDMTQEFLDSFEEVFEPLIQRVTSIDEQDPTIAMNSTPVVNRENPFAFEYRSVPRDTRPPFSLEQTPQIVGRPNNLLVRQPQGTSWFYSGHMAARADGSDLIHVYVEPRKINLLPNKHLLIGLNINQARDLQRVLGDVISIHGESSLQGPTSFQSQNEGEVISGNVGRDRGGRNTYARRAKGMERSSRVRGNRDRSTMAADSYGPNNYRQPRNDNMARETGGETSFSSNLYEGVFPVASQNTRTGISSSSLPHRRPEEPSELSELTEYPASFTISTAGMPLNHASGGSYAAPVHRTNAIGHFPHQPLRTWEQPMSPSGYHSSDGIWSYDVGNDYIPAQNIRQYFQQQPGTNPSYLATFGSTSSCSAPNSSIGWNHNIPPSQQWPRRSPILPTPNSYLPFRNLDSQANSTATGYMASHILPNSLVTGSESTLNIEDIDSLSISYISEIENLDHSASDFQETPFDLASTNVPSVLDEPSRSPENTAYRASGIGFGVSNNFPSGLDELSDPESSLNKFLMKLSFGSLNIK